MVGIPTGLLLAFVFNLNGMVRTMSLPPFSSLPYQQLLQRSRTHEIEREVVVLSSYSKASGRSELSLCVSSQGLWLGIVCGSISKLALLLWIALRIDWESEVSNTNGAARLFFYYIAVRAA